MVKISNFFKKEEPPEEEPKGEPRETSGLKIPRDTELEKGPKKESGFGISEETLSKDASQIMKDKLKLEDKQKTEELYQEAISLVKDILDKGKNNESIEGKKIKGAIERLVDQLVLENSILIGLVRNSTSENYLYAHCVNVCILSVILGIGLGYKREELSELGVAAFLHDIGMIKIEDIIQKSEELTAEEYERIKAHPKFGVELLELSKDLAQSTIYVTHEHHERIDGKGYPQGLKNERIIEFARIVSISDTYEALTHPRPHREKLLPYDALKKMFEDKEHFDTKFLKLFVKQIGIYPIGSLVHLSNGEIGRVVEINKSYPLRPIVNILYDSQAKQVSESKILDLTKYPTLYIKNAIDEKELPA